MSSDATLPYFELFDIRGLLPNGWQGELASAIATQSKRSNLLGGAPTSLEKAGTVISIDLLEGDDVRASLPWLFHLYETECLALARRASGEDVIVDEIDKSAVNVNVLPPGGGGYELHVDSNPITGLLFLSTHEQEDGGLLEINTGDDHWMRIAPIAGAFAVFDARRAPHRVTPSATRQRVSAPMNYFLRSEGRLRPDGLDARLYDNSPRSGGATS